MNTPEIPKVASQDIQNEVQDFSMPSKKQSAVGSAGKGKLDDMLNKLKKKNNCVSFNSFYFFAIYYFKFPLNSCRL